MASSNQHVGRRRFIAGALCPGCGVEDKVFVANEESGIYRGCSQCGFREKLDDLPGGSDSSDGPDASEVQVVKLPS
ncbi:MAG: putative metal-binding protein (TIGR02443 family) [Candidatus Azotimanducaceae bacterium]|jgi:uncharacterized metal-binding protein (TIGR02443 family)